MFWFDLNFWWIWLDKRKNVLENLLKDRGQAGFFMFSHWQHKIFIAETKKIQTDLNFFFLLQQQKILEKKLQNKEI